MLQVSGGTLLLSEMIFTSSTSITSLINNGGIVKIFKGLIEVQTSGPLIKDNSGQMLSIKGGEIKNINNYIIDVIPSEHVFTGIEFTSCTKLIKVNDKVKFDCCSFGSGVIELENVDKRVIIQGCNFTGGRVIGSINEGGLEIISCKFENCVQEEDNGGGIGVSMKGLSSLLVTTSNFTGCKGVLGGGMYVEVVEGKKPKQLHLDRQN